MKVSYLSLQQEPMMRRMFVQMLTQAMERVTRLVHSTVSIRPSMKVSRSWRLTLSMSLCSGMRWSQERAVASTLVSSLLTGSVVLVSPVAGEKLAMVMLVSMKGASRGADMTMLSMATHTMLQVQQQPILTLSQLTL